MLMSHEYKIDIYVLFYMAFSVFRCIIFWAMGSEAGIELIIFDNNFEVNQGYAAFERFFVD